MRDAPVSPDRVMPFALASLLVGVALTLAVLLGARALGRPLAPRALPFVLLTAVFVAMTQYPFPLPGSLECPVGPSAEPNLRPFVWLNTIGALIEQEVPVWRWPLNRHIAATALNFLVCAAIGAALAPLTRSLAVAAGFGLGLTLTVELTQLTAFWGLYPCPWRQFNVDDLIMNATGVLAGFALARRLLRRWDGA